MSEQELTRVLAQAVDHVLETMFFSASFGPLELNALEGQPTTGASVAFDGPLSGSLSLHVSQEAARSMAADFLGEDSAALAPEQITQVICELTNMVCGSVIAALDAGPGRFRISAPIATASSAAIAPGTTACAFALADGALAVSLAMSHT